MLDPDLRADLVVDALEGVLVGGLEELAVRQLGHLGEGLRVGRDADRPHAAVPVGALDGARIGAEGNGVDRDAGILCLLRRLERLVVTGRVRAVGEEQDDDGRLVGFARPAARRGS